MWCISLCEYASEMATHMPLAENDYIVQFVYIYNQSNGQRNWWLIVLYFTACNYDGCTVEV